MMEVQKLGIHDRDRVGVFFFRPLFSQPHDEELEIQFFSFFLFLASIRDTGKGRRGVPFLFLLKAEEEARPAASSLSSLLGGVFFFLERPTSSSVSPPFPSKSR